VVVAVYRGLTVCVSVKCKKRRPVEFDDVMYVIVFGTCPKQLLNTSADITDCSVFIWRVGALQGGVTFVLYYLVTDVNLEKFCEWAVVNT
jgi:hypothetical protein